MFKRLTSSITLNDICVTLTDGVAIEKRSIDRLMLIPNIIPHSKPQNIQAKNVTKRGTKSDFLLLQSVLIIPTSTICITAQVITAAREAFGIYLSENGILCIENYKNP